MNNRMDVATPTLPDALVPVLRACSASGGRALLVGGCVRDALLCRPVKDLDIEVHGLGLPELRAILARFGRVNEVGRSFGVLKLRLGPDEIDISLPRRDSKGGPGHKGIAVITDPDLGITEAARRRDLTINAIAWDALTGEYLDPFDGTGDLQRRTLRAVDRATFGEDPLRALRVAQFAARFEFDVDPGLEALCAAMPLDELPAERIRGEIEKLLLRADRPSLGWEFARRTGMFRRVLPEWDIPAPPRLDTIASSGLRPEEARFSVLLASALNPATAVPLLDRLRIHRWQGFAVRGVVSALVTARQSFPDAPAANSMTDTEVRRLAETVSIPLFSILVGSPTLDARATVLGVQVGPLPVLLAGRQLERLGVPAGPAMGTLMRAIRDAQLEGQISSAEEALAWARDHLR